MPLIITPDAEADIAEARRWYERKRKGLGQEFELCVDEAVKQVRTIPLSGREIRPGVRRVLVPRFPYLLLYVVDVDQIAVLAVYDDRRNPAVWQARLDDFGL
ncbi:MAG: type II toxin-antitoxin system RelE/ParE family toxin [Gemmataceae bacterium]